MASLEGPSKNSKSSIDSPEISFTRRKSLSENLLTTEKSDNQLEFEKCQSLYNCKENSVGDVEDYKSESEEESRYLGESCENLRKDEGLKGLFKVWSFNTVRTQLKSLEKSINPPRQLPQVSSPWHPKHHVKQSYSMQTVNDVNSFLDSSKNNSFGTSILNVTEPSNDVSVLQFDPGSIANQLTLLDYSRFCKISPKELDSKCGW